MQEHERPTFDFSSFIPKVNLCDDGASFLTPKSSLEEVFDPLLTILSLIVPSLSSTSRASTVFIMTFLDPPFSLV